jgi:hypothetical protein
MRDWIEQFFATVGFFGLFILLYVLAVIVTGADPKYW